MKRILLTLLFLRVPILMFAQHYDFASTCISGQTLYYRISSSNQVAVTYPEPYYDDEGEFATGYDGYSMPSGNIIIPKYVKHGYTTYQVTSIDESAFRGCYDITGLTIPNSITSIGSNAFANIPTSHWSIEKILYRGNYGSWNNITMGNGLSSPLQNGTQLIYTDYDFSWVVTSGQRLYFNYTTSSTISVTYEDEHEQPNCDGTGHDVLYYSYGQAPTGAVVIPSSFTFGGITYVVNGIGPHAFGNCKRMTSITIPSSITNIGEDAFDLDIDWCESRDGGALNRVNYQGSLSQWESIDFATLMSNPLNDGHNLYIGGSLVTTAIFPDATTAIKPNVFCGATCLTSAIIPQNVVAIGSGAFSWCSNLSSITVNAQTPPTGWGVLTITSNPSIIVPCGSVEAYRNSPSWSNLGSIDEDPSCYKTLYYTILPNNKVKVSPPYGSSFSVRVYNWSDFVIPSTVTYDNTEYEVTTIAEEAFYNWSDLTSITLPATITESNQNAFNGCSQLSAVYYEGTLSQWCDITFNSYYSNPVFVAHNLYIDNTLLTDLIIPDGKTIIKGRTFTGANCITSLSMPNSVTQIGENVFSGCYNLSSVSFSDALTTIGQYAFDNCSSLTQIDIPNSVTTIGKSAFQYCSGLTSVTIGNSVTTIGNSVFYYCSGLTSVTIGNSVTSIGEYAFYNCSGLRSVTIPNSVTTIGNYAFYDCNGLTSVIIGNSVTSIGGVAFGGCSSLKTVYNLSNLHMITPNDHTSPTCDYYFYANRVVKCTEHFGAGDNIIYKIPTSYSFVDVEDNVETHIPRSTVPTNFIYYDNSAKDGGSWKAKNIVLTDGQDAFEAPETFTAETATYTREFTNSNRSTLYLPFTAAIPENFEVYDFTSFANNTISFTKREDSIYAYTPYLVGYDLSKDGNTTTCTITKTNAVFPKSESANYHPVTRNGMTFQGVLERTEMTSTNNYGYSNGFFVQSGGHAHVNPFRSYFTYTAPAGAPQSLPPTLNVEVGYGDPLDIDAVETPEQEYDGRYGKDVYDMLGRLVRKNADNLDGLPQGIYLWKGKKFMNYE